MLDSIHDVDVLAISGILVAAAGLVAVVLLRVSGKSKADGGAAEQPKVPWTRSEILSLLGIVIGASLGLAGFLLPGNSRSEPEPESEISPVALAALVRQGPFSQSLPEGLEPKGLADVSIGESSAAGRIEALELRAAHSDDVGFFAHLEIYPTPEAAVRRASARIETIERIYEGEDILNGGPESYCAYKTIRAPLSWECGGTAGLVFAEATVSPSANAYQPLATGTVAAILRYTSEKAQLAAGS
jgi:hypothetical protein